jgi:hypothetical protein
MMVRGLLAALLFLLVGIVLADGTGSLEVSGAWARPTAPGATTGAVYLRLHNLGNQMVTVLGVRSTIADLAEIHRTTMTQGMMGMVPVGGVTISPNEVVELQPGGMHIMLIGLKESLDAGAQFPLRLELMGGEELSVEVMVGDREQMHAH